MVYHTTFLKKYFPQKTYGPKISNNAVDGEWSSTGRPQISCHVSIHAAGPKHNSTSLYRADDDILAYNQLAFVFWGCCFPALLSVNFHDLTTIILIYIREI